MFRVGYHLAEHFHADRSAFASASVMQVRRSVQAKQSRTPLHDPEEGLNGEESPLVALVHSTSI